MEINIKNNNLIRAGVYFIMLLFAVCVTMNAFFCSTYNFSESSDKTTKVETGEIPKSIVINADRDNDTDAKVSFLNKKNSDDETIGQNIRSIFMITAIPKGISLFLFLIAAFLFFLASLFILLPDEWTLINQKVRLDN